MDNSRNLRFLAEGHRGRVLEKRGRTLLLPGQPRLTFPGLRKVIVTRGGFLIQTDEAPKGIGAPGEAFLYSTGGPKVLSGIIHPMTSDGRQWFFIKEGVSNESNAYDLPSL